MSPEPKKVDGAVLFNRLVFRTSSTLGFDPRPRVGGDFVINFRAGCGYVSIHAPVWGATTDRPQRAGAEEVSIHAPVWGATRHQGTLACSACGFDPRPRVGGDGCRIGDAIRLGRFDPRPRVGGDMRSRSRSRMDRAFRSTPPCGGRLGDPCIPMGGRAVSIHAPVWGATPRAIASSAQLSFRSTPPCGGRLTGFQGFRYAFSFRSTPPCGGRPWCQRLYSLLR